MKKKYLVISFLLFSSFGFSQETYYSDINTELTTLTGIPLKNAIATKIINTHSNPLDYTPDIWEACRVTDEDSSNSSNVVLIYGWENGTDGDITNNLSRNKNSNGGNNGDWNREHTFANSLAVPKLESTGKSGPPYSDAHNLRASDVQRNGFRGNLKFADGSGNSGNSGGGWYPGDATTGGTDWRGDVARITMYMYLRYGNQCLPRYNSFGTTNSVDADMVNLLLEWNAADPVSDYEDTRNAYHDSNGTYAQGNRNPFIDNPYLATLIWGGTPAEDRWGIYATDTENPSVPMNLSVSNESSSSIDLDWDSSTDNVGVTGYDIYVDGIFNSSSSTNSYTVTGLSTSTTYSFAVLAKDLANNNSAQSAAVNGTTIAGNSGETYELFFSEYVEGSSNNKILEIANINDNDISLDEYSIKLSANGAADWTTNTQLLTGKSILGNDVFVLADSSNAICTAEEDITSGVTSFNGNDAIGLFKNDVLIDIIGVLGNDAVFASNTTLVRNNNIETPSTTYNTSEWTSFPNDTCTDIGSHSVVLNIKENTLFTDVKIYPNPISSNHLNILSNQDLTIQVFNILGKQVLTHSVTKNKTKINVSSLNTGIYLIRLSSDDGSTTRKFIKQ